MAGTPGLTKWQAHGAAARGSGGICRRPKGDRIRTLSGARAVVPSQEAGGLKGRTRRPPGQLSSRTRLTRPALEDGERGLHAHGEETPALDATAGRVENHAWHVDCRALVPGDRPPRRRGTRRRLRRIRGRSAIGVRRPSCPPGRLPAVPRRPATGRAPLGAAPEDLRGARVSPDPRSGSPARPWPCRHGRLPDLPRPAQFGGGAPRLRSGAASLLGMPRPALHVPGGVRPGLRLPGLPRAARRRPELPPAGRREQGRGAARRKVTLPARRQGFSAAWAFPMSWMKIP